MDRWIDEIGCEIACNLRWLLTPRANDVPDAGCALFGVVLCRQGMVRERDEGWFVRVWMWVYAALVWQVRGRKVQAGRSKEEDWRKDRKSVV